LCSYSYKNTVGGKEEREAILSEEDTVWTSVRHLHMKEAIDTLMQDFQKFAQEHAGFRAGCVLPPCGELRMLTWLKTRFGQHE
jgi:hypothetical protein